MSPPSPGPIGSAPGPCFTVAADWLPAAAALREAGLPDSPLAGVRIPLARTGAGLWHLDGQGYPETRCPRLRSALRPGSDVASMTAGLLDGHRLCRACAARIRPSGPAGHYLDLVRHILAARSWTAACEQAAATADWPSCARWTARTPFTAETVPAMISTLPDDLGWNPARRASEAAWQDLRERAGAAHEQARRSAGPPGLRAHAAAARAIVGQLAGTDLQNHIIANIAGLPPGTSRPSPAWPAGSRAWADALSLDGHAGAARTALIQAIEDIYADQPVINVALLPERPVHPGNGYSSPAEWARAEYWALRHALALTWCKNLEEALADVQAAGAVNTAQWRLLLVVGWPPAERDHELAYLAAYPELARDQAGPAGRPGPAAVVLHVPGFAARHGEAHASPGLTAIAGDIVPAGTSPSPAQLTSLLGQVPVEQSAQAPARPSRAAAGERRPRSACQEPA